MNGTFAQGMDRRTAPLLILLAVAAAVTGIAAVLHLAPDAMAEDATAPRVDPVLRPLRPWLDGDDPILRAMAAFDLRFHDHPGAVYLAMGALQRSKDDLTAGCALGSLADRPREALVAEGGALLAALLVRFLAHEHPVLRERAWQALRTLADHDPGLEAGDPRAWWLKHRLPLQEEQARLLEVRRNPKGGIPLAPGETATVPAPVPTDHYDYVTKLRRDGLELCIVMDHTGSMGTVIGAARGRAASLVRRLVWLVPRFRAGLVTYDDEARLRLALTGDGEALEKAFSKVSAGGGGDWEEGVDKGIRLALRQERMAWSRKARRVLVVIGDAPPHMGDVPGLLKRIAKARDHYLYEHSLVVNTVACARGGVDHFAAIAAAGGGVYLALEDVRRLEEEMVAMTFGSAFRERVKPWLEEVDLLRGPSGAAVSDPIPGGRPLRR